VFAEETLRRHSFRVEDVHERNCVFRQRRCEDDHFEVLADLFDELAAVGAYVHKDVGCPTLDVDWQNNVSDLSRRERRVNQGLVYVEQQSFATLESFGLRPQQVLLLVRCLDKLLLLVQI